MTCNPNFYLDNKTCHWGAVSNCDVMASKYKCTTCATGFWKIGSGELQNVDSHD